jgi:hypothetical protein
VRAAGGVLRRSQPRRLPRRSPSSSMSATTRSPTVWLSALASARQQLGRHQHSLLETWCSLMDAAQVVCCAACVGLPTTNQGLGAGSARVRYRHIGTVSRVWECRGDSAVLPCATSSGENRHAQPAADRRGRDTNQSHDHHPDQARSVRQSYKRACSRAYSDASASGSLASTAKGNLDPHPPRRDQG